MSEARGPLGVTGEEARAEDAAGAAEQRQALTLSPDRITRPAMRSECDRTRLIEELASLLRDCELPDEARHAGLTLIGWLARRMPGEGPSLVGVEQASRQRGHSAGCVGAAGAHANTPSDVPHPAGGEHSPSGGAAPMAPLGDTSSVPTHGVAAHGVATHGVAAHGAAAHGASVCCGSVVARVSAAAIGMRKSR